MSTNVEALAQAFAGWGKDEPAKMRDVLADDCDLIVPDSIPYADTAVLRDTVEGVTPA
jgi:hypothetical protein